MVRGGRLPRRSGDGGAGQGRKEGKREVAGGSEGNGGREGGPPYHRYATSHKNLNILGLHVHDISLGS